MLNRLYRAWRYYDRLDYSWHLAWYKAAAESRQNLQGRKKSRPVLRVLRPS